MAVVMVCGNQAIMPERHNGWSEDSDSQHSFGNGLRFRTPQRSSHCYRGSAFRVHIDNKSFIYGIEKEG